MFDRWTTSDAFSKKASDVRLLLLGTLRCLGRAHSFDDVFESTCISGDVHRVFLAFLEHGSTVLHEIHATLPVVSTNLFELEEMLIITGLNGFLGSTDVTRIRMLSCAV